MSVEMKIKIKMSMWAVIKWRLLGFHKKDIKSKSVGEVTEIQIESSI